MTHPGYLGMIQDLERQLLASMPVSVRRVKERHLNREIAKARRAGYSAQAIVDARQRGKVLEP
jgi:hypothetical protein